MPVALPTPVPNFPTPPSDPTLFAQLPVSVGDSDLGGVTVAVTPGPRLRGRVEFQGPSATSGYYNNPEATAALFDNGWVDTGDLGYIAAGELYLTGRSKDMMIRGGQNVYPYELEEAVGTVPGIDDAKFKELADKAKAECPVSRALGAIKVSLDARLA